MLAQTYRASIKGSYRTGEAGNCVQMWCQLGDGVCLRGVGETTRKVEFEIENGER
jgi:hypothetical protein